MSETRYYFGDQSDLDGLTREEVIELTDADDVGHEDRYEEMITELYDTVSIGELTWDAGRVLRELDPIAFRCGLADLTCEIDLDDYSSSSDEYVSVCPACGEFIGYCLGHGDLGDPDGAAILDAHDDGIHDVCHPAAVSSGQCD